MHLESKTSDDYLFVKNVCFLSKWLQNLCALLIRRQQPTFILLISFHFGLYKKNKNYINWQNTHFHFVMEEETRTYMKVENRDVAPNLHKYVSIYVYNTGIFYHLCRVPMVYMKLCKEILRKNLVFSVKIYKIFMPSFVFLFMMC